MSNASPRGRSRLPAVLIIFAAAFLLTALTCAGGNAAAVVQRLDRGPIVWHAGRLALSAEITVSPHCAPLAQTCWVQHPARRPRYLSAWVYLSTPPNVPWQLTKWHVIVVPIGREEG